MREGKKKKKEKLFQIGIQYISVSILKDGNLG